MSRKWTSPFYSNNHHNRTHFYLEKLGRMDKLLRQMWNRNRGDEINWNKEKIKHNGSFSPLICNFHITLPPRLRHDNVRHPMAKLWKLTSAQVPTSMRGYVMLDHVQILILLCLISKVSLQCFEPSSKQAMRKQVNLNFSFLKWLHEWLGIKANRLGHITELSCCGAIMFVFLYRSN